jgi:chromosome segregation ATPase
VTFEISTVLIIVNMDDAIEQLKPQVELRTASLEEERKSLEDRDGKTKKRIEEILSEHDDLKTQQKGSAERLQLVEEKLESLRGISSPVDSNCAFTLIPNRRSRLHVKP